jgi:pyruvate dehydrogenase E2 component (dihydrolipoamide acetyltransferase)
MPTEIIMPKVDMVMESGTFVEWLKNEGDRVEKGQPLFVILTDKAAIEIEAPASGILAGLSAKRDEVIPVTSVIGYILKEGEAVPSTARMFTPETQKESPGTYPIEKIPAAGEKITGQPSQDGPVRATPLARKMAGELGLDLSKISGRGPRGRIYRADILQEMQNLPKQPSSIQPVIHPDAAMAGGQVFTTRVRERIPLKGARAIIARRMAYSAATSPHIHLGINVDMTEMVRWRQKVGPKIENRLHTRLSYTAMIAFVVARLLIEHPYLNSSLVEDEIVLWEDVHLGIATALGDDLIVPVVRQAQTLSLEEMVKEMNRLLEAARALKLLPSEMSGSTFTISNLGMYGIEDFTAILNPPEAGILAVAKMVDTPVALDGQVVIRPIIHLTVGADHRINDGLRVARFLNDLQTMLENPYLLF